MMVGVWIDATGDNPQERYGERLRAWSHAFAAADSEPQAGDITLDPVHYAMTSWDLATRPTDGPPYVRFHPRVLHATCHRPEGTYIILAVVRLAAPSPEQLPHGWFGWQQGESGVPCVAPPFDRRAALFTLELRVPIQPARLPTPTRPEAEGLPNLGDAQAALETLVEEINTAVVPFLRILDATGV